MYILKARNSLISFQFNFQNQKSNTDTILLPSLQTFKCCNRSIHFFRKRKKFTESGSNTFNCHSPQSPYSKSGPYCFLGFHDLTFWKIPGHFVKSLFICICAMFPNDSINNGCSLTGLTQRHPAFPLRNQSYLEVQDVSQDSGSLIGIPEGTACPLPTKSGR